MNIAIEQITKKFDKLKALDDISLNIQQGEIVALLGTNGAGKTTLLMMLAGILAADKGKIYYDGKEFNRGKMNLRRRFLFLPDLPAVYLNMTPIKHIGMVIRLFNIHQDGMENKVTTILNQFDLLPHANTPMFRLSKGQIYKTALTAAIAVNPDLLLLDEPFASGMDPNGLSIFKKYMRLSKKNGKTVLYSTQILEVNEGFCDHICILHKGKLAIYKSMKEIKDMESRENNDLEHIFEQLRVTPH